MFTRPTLLTTLRGKLSLWYVTTMLSVVILLTTLFAGSFWYVLHNQIDHHLHIVVSEAQKIVEQYVGNQRDELLKGLVLGKGMTIMLLSTDGTPIVQTNSGDVALMSEHRSQQVLARRDLSEWEPTHFTLQNMRFAAIRVREAPGNGILVVGYSLDVVNQTFQTLMLLTMLVMIVVVVPFAVFGFRRVKKHLQPLESLANLMETITSKEELSARLHSPTETTELHLIIGSFNTMLAKIESLFTTEQHFFSDAAHTLKTPLAVLRAQAESLEEKKIKQKMLLTIDEAAATVSDLLLLARNERRIHEKYKHVSLSEHTFALFELMTTLAKKKQIAVTSTIQRDVFVRANPSLLHRAINNLIHNAVNYTNEKGSIHLTLTGKNRVATLAIQNTGKGLTIAERRHVFKRFFRGKNTGITKGNGLGLAIAKAIVEKHNGTLALTSKREGPTRIKVTLPLARSTSTS